MKFWQKVALIVGILFLFIIIGSGIMMWVLESAGISIEDIRSPQESTFTDAQVSQLKLAFGLNHFVSFVCSGFVLVFLFSKGKWQEYTGAYRAFNFQLFLKFLALLMLSYPIFSAIILTFQNLPLPEWANQMDSQNLGTLEQLLTMDSPLDFVINLIIIALFAGIGEELIFRGVVQKELYRYVRPAYAIIISATIFGLFHFEVTGLIPKIIIGGIMGFAYYLTSNLVYPILIHITNNATQVVLLYFSGVELGAEGTTPEPSLTVALLTGLIFTPIVYFYGRHIYQNHNLNGQDT